MSKPCETCGSGNEYEPKVCDCCRLVDGDERVKSVRWCTLCQAFICAACENDDGKRVQAFSISTVEKVAKAFKMLAESLGLKKNT